MYQNPKNAILVKESLTCDNPHSHKMNHSYVAMWKATLLKVSPKGQ